MRHAPYLSTDPLLRSYTAGCGCGWSGQEEKSKLGAMKHFTEHFLAAIELEPEENED
jgi:hypothetical protein